MSRYLDKGPLSTPLYYNTESSVRSTSTLMEVMPELHN